MSLLFQTLFGLFALLSLVHQLDGHNFGPNDQEWSNIIGGEKVHQEHSLPMLVTININLTTKVELLGSGVIINKNWILTVGHLFNEFEEEDFANVLVGHGSLDRTKQSLAKVNHIYSSYFNLTTRLGDIAFLHVPNIGQNVFAETSSLRMIIKNTTTLNSSAKLLLPGFGSTNTSARREPSTTCQVATLLHVTPIEECRKKLLSHRNQHVIIDNSNLCAASHNQTACYGDSGSPLFELFNNNQTVHLFGLISWGENSCTLNFPNVFTKLYHYRTLIHNITGFDHWLP